MRLERQLKTRLHGSAGHWKDLVFESKCLGKYWMAEDRKGRVQERALSLGQVELSGQLGENQSD